MSNKLISKHYSQLRFGLIVVCTIFFIFTAGYINQQNKWNGILIEISMGFLAFVSLFYPLIIKKEITKKREGMLVQKWGEYLPDFRKHLKQLQLESNKEKPLYKNMLSISEQIQEKLNNMTLFEFEINIGKQVIQGIFGYIIGVLLFLADSLTNFDIPTPQGDVGLRLIAYGIFIFSVFKTVELLLTWIRVTSED